jgi:hypothetical protein
VPRVTENVAALSPERVEESDAAYILSTQGDASVKIRDELMEVKHLETVNGQTRDGSRAI